MFNCQPFQELTQQWKTTLANSSFNEYSIKGHKGLPVLLQLGTVLIIHLTLGLPAGLVKAIVGHTMLLDFSLNH